MFDARSILDILVRGAGPPRRQGQPPDAGTFRDLLGQLGEQGASPGGRPRPMPGPREEPEGRWARPGYPEETERQPSPAPSGGSLEDLLREILGGGAGQPGSASGRQMGPGGQAEPPRGSLLDILRDLLTGGPGGGPRPELSRVMGEGSARQGGDAGLLDTLKQILGQATSGVREGAARIDEATGASGRAREALGQATGQTPEELVAKIRELFASNPLAASAALGGLGALVLGTGAGRSLAASAAKLGGLALIGGLAYKAYQNYQQGKPILPGGRPGETQALAAAPNGSGFEPGVVSDEAARRYIRTMIAAAAADGRIDAAEQQKILGGVRQAGIERAAQQFLAAEINNPATAAELAAGVNSPEEAVQVYTAARVAMDLDTNEEHEFLSSLAEALGIDDNLAAQVDAAARGAASA
jgi:uncharacterized membrane protein YebE (DUF533 family)